MDEIRNIYGNPRAGAVGVVLLYVLLACILAVLFCWRVASTTPRKSANGETRQIESLTTEKR